MKPLCSGINVSINAGSNARTSPDLPNQQKRLTGRSRFLQALQCDQAQGFLFSEASRVPQSEPTTFDKAGKRLLDQDQMAVEVPRFERGRR
jgi:hypothetical protein